MPLLGPLRPLFRYRAEGQSQNIDFGSWVGMKSLYCSFTQTLILQMGCSFSWVYWRR